MTFVILFLHTLSDLNCICYYICSTLYVVHDKHIVINCIMLIKSRYKSFLYYSPLRCPLFYLLYLLPPPFVLTITEITDNLYLYFLYLYFYLLLSLSLFLFLFFLYPYLYPFLSFSLPISISFSFSLIPFSIISASFIYCLIIIIIILFYIIILHSFIPSY